MSNKLLKSTIEKFWEVVPSTWVNVRAKVRTNATHDHDLTLIQFHILRHIRNGFCTVAELADRQHVSRPAISQAVEQLFKKNLVLRTPDPNDRRYVQLSLTEKGEDLLDTVFGKTKSWMEAQIASLSPQELDTLNQAFTILKNTLQKSGE